MLLLKEVLYLQIRGKFREIIYRATKFAKMAAKHTKVFDIKNTIINQPSLTLQFNNTIMNHPVTYKLTNKYLVNLIFFRKYHHLMKGKKKSAPKTRKPQCIMQQLKQYEKEVEGRGSSKIIASSRNFLYPNLFCKWQPIY